MLHPPGPARTCAAAAAPLALSACSGPSGEPDTRGLEVQLQAAAAAVEAARARVEAARLDLGCATIRSPVTGQSFRKALGGGWIDLADAQTAPAP